MTLPLDTFRAELGLHPYFFWGLTDQRYTPINSKCPGLTYEYDWQGSDAAGRVSVREAINAAEAKLRGYLGFWPSPRYIETDPIAWPPFNDVSQVRYLDLDATGRRVAIAAPDGYIQAMGIEQLTLLGIAAVDLTTLTGATGEPYYTFSMTLTVSATLDLDTVAVYFSSSDRLDGAPVGDRWRIEPVTLSLSGTNLTITGRAWLIVRPVLYLGYAGAAIDPTDASNFAGDLEIYTRTTNGDGTSVNTCQATLIYETNDCGACWGRCCCSTGTVSSDPSTVGEVIARAGIRDRRLGLITPAAAVYDPVAGAWTSQWCCSASYCDPDRVKLRYLAGYPLDGPLAAHWRSVVVKLAAAELKRRICACRETNEKLHDLQLDMALESTQTERYRRTDAQMNNPFGTRLGHIQAWLESKDYLIRRGHLA